jgi:predicted TIM-barrel fold metal-dependent hydrolase
MQTARRLPVGTCDAHMHVFGPLERYPLTPVRNYTPHLMTIEDYRRVMAAFGIDRAVLVQPSVYGMDNGALLDALRSDPEHLRGVVVVPSNISDADIRLMHELGVRGIRINRRNPGGLSLDDALNLARRIEPLGWHLQLQIEIAREPELMYFVGRCRIPIVIDHFGFINPTEGVASPHFQNLLSLLAAGQIWVKLSAPYRISRDGHPFADLIPFIESLVICRPDRLLWATDWPHTELWNAMPDETELLDTLPIWRFSAEIQQAIFAKNPGHLYWH